MNGGNGNDEERGLISGIFNRREEPRRNREKRARDESFFDAIIINLCPTVRCCTFTVFIIFVDIIMFIISLWMYRIVNTEFLAPNPRALDALGWKDARKIKKRGQVWRFITPTFLHASFVHLTLNLLSTVVIGSGLENGLGCWKLCALYFISSFGGILFSCVFNPLSYSVGASTAIFGLIGYYVSCLLNFC
jgi:membrane associated rhomboid family serine protease